MDTVKANSDIYSVKANSQAGNIRGYMMTTQKGQSCKTLSKGLKKNYVLPKNSVGALGPGQSAVGITYLSLRIHLKS